MKYILVTGGVISGLGKGTATSSIGLLLRQAGFNVTAIKIDPYLNIDAGTMSPYEHGECFVLDDGGEVDLDLGNYERFLNIDLTKDHNITSGKLYQQVLNKERKGDFLGKTVQMVPHMSEAAQAWIERVARIDVGYDKEPDVCLIELGGTVGDIESQIYFEALRGLKFKCGSHNFFHIHVTLVPLINNEPKTKPTQHSIKALKAEGFSPNIIACRSKTELSYNTKQKIAQSAMLPLDYVLSYYDVGNLYRVPRLLLSQNILDIISNALEMYIPEPDLEQWSQLEMDEHQFHQSVKIGIVGKYTGLHDSYLSITKALKHAGYATQTRVEIHWLSSEALNFSSLSQMDGILVPGGFGERGIQGKIDAASWALNNQKPYLGICLGMQVAVIAAARRTLFGAHSTEFETKTRYPVVIFMPEGSTSQLGGTMRLGCRRTFIHDEKSLAYRIYGSNEIYERHRHRYEVNPEYVSHMEEKMNTKFSGTDLSKSRMEILEIPNHPFYFGTQFHPEFNSRPLCPSPVFVSFIQACLNKS